MEHSIIKKLTDVKVVTKSWTPEGGVPVTYKRLSLEFVINGNKQEFLFKIDANTSSVLESLADKDSNFLDDPQLNVG